MITNKQSFIQVSELPLQSKYKQIMIKDIQCIKNLNRTSDLNEVPWKFSFEIFTSARVYQLYAPT